MLSTTLERLGGLFERQFLVAYWSPVFVGAALIAVIAAVANGFAVTLRALLHLTPTEQILFGIATLMGITVLAYVFSGITAPVIQMYEGYWPSWLQVLAKPLYSMLLGHQMKKQNGLLTEMAQQREQTGTITPANLSTYLELYQRFFPAFPRDKGLVRPTRLGNILVAAEEYPQLHYDMDAVFWWPRMISVMSDGIRAEVDAAITSMIALLNLGSTMAVVGPIGGIWLFAAHGLWLWSLICVAAAILLALICYMVATMQAKQYTQIVRAAFDLYRFDLLKQMHIPLPSSPAEERRLWKRLGEWLYYNDRRCEVDRYEHTKVLST